MTARRRRHLDARAAQGNTWLAVDALGSDLDDSDPIATITFDGALYEVSLTGTPGYRSYFPTLSGALVDLETASDHPITDRVDRMTVRPTSD
jgi:hypothetical protein